MTYSYYAITALFVQIQENLDREKRKETSLTSARSLAIRRIEKAYHQSGYAERMFYFKFRQNAASNPGSCLSMIQDGASSE
jgi:hypothetical protein